MRATSKHDYPALFEEYDHRLASGESPKEIRAIFASRGVNWGTFQNRRTQAKKAHLGTPEEHQEFSLEDSTMEHYGVPARQDHLISTPIVHPDTPTEEDWHLWERIKERWEDMEMMLSIWHLKTLRHGPRGTPRHTMKKTYVVDSLYVELIDRYAQDTGAELKDIVNAAFQEFFARRDYLPKEEERR